MWRRPAQRLGEHEARCRDEDGHRARIGVGITDTGRVTVALAPTEVRVLDPLGVGRLRGLLRDAVLALDEQAS